MSHQYEIEIKSLLGSREKADKLRRELLSYDPNIKKVSKGSELNHYFNTPEDLHILIEVISPLIHENKRDALEKIVNEGKKVSIRSRQARGKVLFIMKASIGDDTSANGISRIEFEAEVPGTLNELDSILLNAGLTYQAKWSREREEYASKNTHVTIDKNAGYGYLAEFERITDDSSMVEEVKRELLALMNELGVDELPQDRLERMFAHYNKHWNEYYGTDKIFVIE